MIIYEVNDRRFNDNYELLRYVEDHIDGEDLYDQMLYNIYGDEVEICGTMYDTVIAFMRVNEILYKCSMRDYISSVIWDDLNEQVSRMDDGDVLKFNGLTISCKITEDEEDE